MYQDAPAQPAPRGTPLLCLRRWVLGVLGIAAATVIGLIAAVAWQPDFYRAAVVEADPLAAEALARRLVSKASALHAATRRDGAWDAVITDDEINAWLAVDLPRNHSRLLPAGVAAPRVELRDHHARLGARVGIGPFSAVAWLDLEVRWRGVNQVGITVADARVGGLPLPRAGILGEVARRLSAAGLITNLRRLEDGPLLVVAIPSPSAASGGGPRLETLAVADGEVLVAGTTGRGESGGNAK